MYKYTAEEVEILLRRGEINHSFVNNMCRLECIEEEIVFEKSDF
jgi:hypothetical protein